MSSEYRYAPEDDGTYSVIQGTQEIARTPSKAVAKRVCKALNLMDNSEAQRFTVVNRMKEWRLRRDLTQAQLADLIGVQQATIYKYETGKLGLDLEVLQRLANALQVHPALLISHGEPK